MPRSRLEPEPRIAATAAGSRRRSLRNRQKSLYGRMPLRLLHLRMKKRRRVLLHPGCGLG
jgi:hypothetical protein